MEKRKILPSTTSSGVRGEEVGKRVGGTPAGEVITAKVEVVTTHVELGNTETPTVCSQAGAAADEGTLVKVRAQGESGRRVTVET